MEKTTFVQSSSFVAVLLTSVLLVIVLLFIGCRPNDRLTTYPAGGSAASEGRPAVGAELRLHPVDGPAAESTILPRANVDAEGKFVFSTYRPNDGAPVGTYKITVTWREPLGTSDPEEIHP